MSDLYPVYVYNSLIIDTESEEEIRREWIRSLEELRGLNRENIFHTHRILNREMSNTGSMSNICKYYRRKDGEFFVAKIGKTIIGFVGICEYDSLIYDINRLTVLPEYRKKGDNKIYYILLQVAISHFLNVIVQKYGRCQLNTIANFYDTRTIGVLQDCGFTCTRKGKNSVNVYFEYRY